ncbi:hypothetical protein PPTG_24197 [Phytophthora nicotianae INRA-310]|uniref:Uncharacterized protein n=1 Tax=Phytophthora nicotianae (strain INRA-310) TaxID=761204 RepID=W2PJE3_PHYN3|nr:hypothetical protein PPTG_24197 [Phytophthora nicotianae INRA-310]ETN00746.1 hypothetical protein PPTG_24197 [Phytophthora nicotianae INRA-310]
MEVLDARVEEVLGYTDAGATKYVYLQALTRFIKWLYETSDEDRRQSLFATSFCDIETINADTIAEWFARSPVVSPIDLSTLTTQECMRYLTSMEQRGVTGKSIFGIVRSAIVYLYNTTGNSLPR